MLVSICPESGFSQRGWRVKRLNHTVLCTSLRKRNQNPVTYQRAFEKPFNASHCDIPAVNPLSRALSPDLVAFYSVLPIQASALPSKWLSWLFFVWLPLNGPRGQMWCNGCLPVGQTASQERKGRTITNQCVQLPQDSKRSCVEAASLFTPKAFWRKRVSLTGWVSGCFLMDWHWRTTVSITYKRWRTNRNNMGWKVILVFFSLLFHTCFKHIVAPYYLFVIRW